MSNRTLHIGLNALPGGCHPAAWRSPHSDHPLGTFNPDHWQHLAQVAERGTFDAIFIADSPSLRKPSANNLLTRFDPTVLLATLAATTEYLGLVGTATTSFEEPYNIARRFGSLDHLSGGRAAWNVVTTLDASAATNYSQQPHLPKSDRYQRAAEFVGVVRALWDSWEDDALIGDQVSGRFADPDRIHTINHHGQYFNVEGPLNIPRSPQGRPVIFQAGGSPAGLALAARYADAVFTAQLALPDALEFANHLRSLVVAQGRSADSIKIMPGLATTIGSTEAEARSRRNELDELSGQSLLGAFAWLIGVKVEELQLDQPLPDSVLNASEFLTDMQGFRDTVFKLARRQHPTVRELLSHIGYGHGLIVGTPEQIADRIEEWFLTGAADGFNLMPDVFPDGVETFVDHVVPILRQRGIFRHEYTGKTLRGHLGLARPANQFRRQQVAETVLSRS